MRMGWLFWVVVLVGCRGSEPPPTALPQVGLFRHDVHLAEGLKCDACHLVDAEQNYVLLRPGSNAHAPCDGCHQHKKLFYQEPSAFCGVCHESVDPLHEGRSPLHAYPRSHNTAQLVASFSHELHLKQTRPGGEKLDCGNCHPVASPTAAYAQFPKHEQCSECHLGSTKPAMSECQGCHEDDGPGYVRKLYKHLQNDIRFTHGKHMVAPTGEQVDCRFCHEDVEQSDKVEHLNLPEMRVCASCHDSGLTPPDQRMKSCGLCHMNDVTSEPLPGDHTGSIEVRRRPAYASSKPSVRERSVRRPDRGGCGEGGPHPGAVTAAKPTFELLQLPSLLKVTASATVSAPAASFPQTHGVFTRPKPPQKTTKRVPQDHTPLFRINHARAAEAPSAACNYCHLGVSGTQRDPCQDCHAVSRPRSHTLRFRTTGHGRLAAQRPKDCAVCHEVDYCSECHSIAPQSHFPLQTFRERHARTARLNARACMTCHTFEATCVRCHSIDVRRSQ